MKPENIYFVTGIDTDAGKSYATGYIARMWSEKGINTITQKLIQTGHPAGAGGEDSVSEDIRLHRRIMGVPLLSEDLDHTTCPLLFSYPASPELASRLDGKPVDLTLADRSTGILASLYDTVLLEGAGGLMVPITEEYTMLDFVKERGYPVIMVTNPKLGSVNHTILNIETCLRHDITVSHLVYNALPATSDIITSDTREFLKKYISRHLPTTEFVEVPIIDIN